MTAATLTMRPILEIRSTIGLTWAAISICSLTRNQSLSLSGCERDSMRR
jgi:hypothetical protein